MIIEKRVNCYRLAVILLLERGQIIIRVLRGLVVVEDYCYFCEMEVSVLVFTVSILID